MITVIRHQTYTTAQPFALIYCHICIKYLSLSATQMSEFSVAITTLEIQHKHKKTNSNSAQFPLNSKDNLTIFALIQDRLITGCKNDPSNPFFPYTLALSPPPLRLQQSLIRIPLPVGHRMQESRCGPQRQRRRVVFQLLHTHIHTHTSCHIRDTQGCHGRFPSKQHLLAYSVHGKSWVCITVDTDSH